MQACPSRDQLEQLTFKTLSPAEEATFASHVQDCAVCQQTVASLSDCGRTLPADASAGSASFASRKRLCPRSWPNTRGTACSACWDAAAWARCTRPTIVCWTGRWS